MPQMAPMPWISILFLTIMILMGISSILFFAKPKSMNKSVEYSEFQYKIKW